MTDPYTSAPHSVHGDIPATDRLPGTPITQAQAREVAASSRYTPPAAQVEAEGAERMSIDWDGIQVKLPATVEDWDPDALEAFETGKAITALRTVLGSRQYDEIRKVWASRKGRKPKLGDMTKLVEDIAKAYGFDGSGE